MTHMLLGQVRANIEDTNTKLYQCDGVPTREYQRDSSTTTCEELNPIPVEK